MFQFSPRGTDWLSLHGWRSGIGFKKEAVELISSSSGDFRQQPCLNVAHNLKRRQSRVYGPCEDIT